MASEVTAAIAFIGLIWSYVLAPSSPITWALLIIAFAALAWETVTIVKRARGLK